MLKLRAGLITRDEAFAGDEFYVCAGELAYFIAQQYPPGAPYPTFEVYFPRLLRDLAQAHPRTIAK